MDISVTELKQRCLEIVRRVERTGKPVAITRRGRVVAQLRRPPRVEDGPAKPWERLRAAGGRLLASPGESVAGLRISETPTRKFGVRTRHQEKAKFGS